MEDIGKTTLAHTVLPEMEIGQNIKLISDTIQSFEAIGDPNEIMDFMQRAVSLQALATETVASAGWYRQQAMDQELDRQATALKGEKIPPSIAKARADAKVRDWGYIYEKAKGLSTDLTHLIDFGRSKISFMKQEIANIR